MKKILLISLMLMFMPMVASARPFDAGTVHAQISTVAPIISVSLGNLTNRATWSIVFDPSATPSQIAAANTMLQTFDFAGADTTELARQASIRGDARRAAMLTRLKTATDAQIDAYVSANITTLAQAQTAIADILKLIALDTRQ